MVGQLPFDVLSQAHVCDDSTDGDLTPHIGPRPTAASLGIGAPVTPAEEPATEDPGDGELDITGLDDEELDAVSCVFLTVLCHAPFPPPHLLAAVPMYRCTDVPMCCTFSYLYMMDCRTP